MNAETPYMRMIASTEIDECRIERIFVKELGQEEIRFSWWPNGRFAPRPLDLPETALLELIRSAIRDGVFTAPFVQGLRELMNGIPDA
jgi:hypothetical protein